MSSLRADLPTTHAKTSRPVNTGAEYVVASCCSDSKQRLGIDSIICSAYATSETTEKIEKEESYTVIGKALQPYLIKNKN